MTPTGNDQDTWVFCDTLFTPFQRRLKWLLQIRGGKIRQMMPAPEVEGDLPTPLIHDPGAIVAPGFIDLHVHGASGKDVMDGTKESLRTVSRALARFGTTSFLATTMSAPHAEIETALRGIAAHRDFPTDGASLLGIHMEGPYLNPLRRGTHDPSCLKNADIRSFLQFIDISGNTIRKLTIAPEMDPGHEVIRQAAALGIRVSMGHSDATEEQARAAIDAGATQATHMFNAMRPYHQREPGIVGVALTDDRVYTEVIADGIHVHAVALRLLLRAKGVERLMLVTDGTSATGMSDGQYALGHNQIVVEGGVCRDSEGHLAGSVLTLDRAIRNLVEWLDIPLHEALTAASATPARSMCIAGAKGIIASGADADLVFLGPDLGVRKTMVAGRVVYDRTTTSDL